MRIVVACCQGLCGCLRIESNSLLDNNNKYIIKNRPYFEPHDDAWKEKEQTNRLLQVSVRFFNSSNFKVHQGIRDKNPCTVKIRTL